MNQTISKRTASLLKLATRASVATALLLICIKFAAWFVTGSLSVLASLIDSVMDAMASIINLLAVRYSLKSADDDHSFGHGKAEALAGLGQSCFIAGSGLILLLHAAEKLTTPTQVSAISLGIGVMALSILLTLVLLAVQYSVIRETHSTAIRADALHYATDLLTNTGTLAALFLAGKGWLYADPLFSIGIALLILHSAWTIGRDAIDLLMDRQLPDEILEQILSIAHKHPEVTNAHDLRTRQSGQTPIIQLHLNIDGAQTLDEAHRISKEVKRDLLDVLPNADIIIHQDPIPAVGVHHPNSP